MQYQDDHGDDDDHDNVDDDGNIPMQPWFGLTQPLSGWVGWIIRFPLEDWGTETPGLDEKDEDDIDDIIDYNVDDNDDGIDYNNYLNDNHDPAAGMEGNNG